MASERGSALVLVLWAALLLSALMALVGSSIRIEAVSLRYDTAATLESISVRNALLAAQHQTEPENNTLSVSDRTFAVSRAPGVGFASLRRLSLDELSTRWPEQDPEIARTYAARFLDWQDTDDRPRVRGSESGAANRPFLTMGEAQNALDLEQGLIPCGQSSSVSERRLPNNRAGSVINITIRSEGNSRDGLSGLYRIPGGNRSPELISMRPTSSYFVSCSSGE